MLTSVGALTLAARRWETAAGGAIAELPLTSGPTSVLPCEILLRMVVTRPLVLLLTLIAPQLGRWLAGLVSPFPVLGSVPAVFAQRRLGKRDPQRLLSAVVLNAFAFAVFCFVVSALLIQHGGALIYSIAAFSSLSMNAVLFAVFRSRI